MFESVAAALEASGLGQAARSSVWLYPLANLAHVLGAALLVGAILAFDVTLLRRRYRLAGEIAATALGIAALGVAMQVISGSVLFSAEVTALIRNPVFLVKLALILVALLNVAIYHSSKRSRSAHDGVPANASLHAIASAGLWIAVAICGRAIAYV